MPPRFGNCAYSFLNSKGKRIFAPSDDGRLIGNEIKALVEERFTPDPFYFHLRNGGHVAALHTHRPKRYIARLDIQNFFYSIGRNRVARALQTIGIARAEHYAKWSTVKNPLGEPHYALPYGFVQSPVLASLVLHLSPLGNQLRAVDSKVLVSVYVDDIAVSSNNRRHLDRTYRKLQRKTAESNFSINTEKSITPQLAISIFNCQLTHRSAKVSDERCDTFYASNPTVASQAGFEAYCTSVSTGNG